MVFQINSPNIAHETNFEKILQKLREQNKEDVKIINVNVVLEAPDTLAELAVGNTDIFDGTVTPVEVDIVSSEAADKSLAVTIIGIDENDAYAEETIATDKSDGTTPVTTTKLWKRLLAFRKVATTGTIVANEVGGSTEQYLSAAPADLYSIGSRVDIPADHEAMILSITVSTVVTQSAGVYVLNGVTFYLDLNGTVEHGYSVGPAEIVNRPADYNILDEETYIAIQHESTNTAANQTTHLDVNIATWKK